MKTCTALLLLLLCGCASGPDFVRPAAPLAQGYTESAPAASASAGAADGAQRIILGAPVALEWWTLFGSDSLNELIHQALAASPTVRAALSAIEALAVRAATPQAGTAAPRPSCPCSSHCSR